MSSVSKPSVANCKKHIHLNLLMLHQCQPMPPQIALPVLNENIMNKLTQNLFNNLSYYLLSIIDPQYYSSMTWPLYDTKTEKVFRSELSRFISDNAGKGVLTDVMSSYLVHPTCYKVTVLIKQLSTLAVKQILIQKYKGTEKQVLFDDSEKNISLKDIDLVVNITKSRCYEISNNLAEFMYKKQTCEIIAEKLRMKILAMEEKLATLKCQKYIDNLIYNFIEKMELDEPLKSEILKIRNIDEPAPIFDDWLKNLDVDLNKLEGKWDDKVMPFLEKCRNMYHMSEELVKRQTGQIEKSSYMLEYDPKRNAICTDGLQNQVHSCQKYVLKNIEQNGKLSFPNLIQGCLISISYIFKNMKFGNEIYVFNEGLQVCQMESSEIRTAYKSLIERVDKADKKLTQNFNIQSISLEEHLQIPPIPDLSSLKMTQNQHNMNFNTFTPLNISKHHFNLHRSKMSPRPLPRSILTNPYAPQDDFLKNLLSFKVSYDHGNISQTSNMSVLSRNKVNETISECSSGFTKQLAKLLSEKKSSIKKHKKTRNNDNNVKIRKGNDSVVSNESHYLFRSYSSPNLFENKNKKHISNICRRKLSIMEEDSTPQLQASGIACLNTNFNTPTGFGKAGSSRNTSSICPKTSDGKNRVDNVQRELENMTSPIIEHETHIKKVTASKIPMIIVHKMNQEMHFPKMETTSEQESNYPKMITAVSPRFSVSPITEQGSDISYMVATRDFQESNHSSKLVTQRLSMSPTDNQERHSKTVTPKPNTCLIEKTSSLEKIINRFRKVRANIRPLREENENLSNANDCLLNRNLLPDLLSPSFLNLTRDLSDNNVYSIDSEF